jgi:alpha-glucoside transport system permease protein
MVIMIWIQTGFAMVVLSAAIKGVPTELLEAARVDGANEPQIFWRVTMPQIRATVIVVITTLSVTVLKIFDLVKATTGGTAGTDVLANRMVDELRNGNFNSSSTFAVMILVLVLPIMWLNVRRASGEVR